MDSHVHLVWGGLTLRQLDLTGARSRDALVAAVSAACSARARPLPLPVWCPARSGPSAHPHPFDARPERAPPRARAGAAVLEQADNGVCAQGVRRMAGGYRAGAGTR